MNKFILLFCHLLSFTMGIAQPGNILEDYNLKGKVKSIAAREWLIKDGKPVKTTVSTGLMNKVTTLNEKGHIVSSIDIDSTAGKKGYAIAYDASGKRTSCTFYGRSQTFRYEYEQPHHSKRITYEVDEKGNRSKVREEILASNGQPTEMTEYFPESPVCILQNGKWTEEAPNRFDITVNRSVYELTEKGKLLQTSAYHNDTLEVHTIYTYDAEGHLTGQNTEWHDGRKETYSWNWKKGVKMQGIRILYNQEKKQKSTSYFYDDTGHVVRELQADHVTNTSLATLYEYTFDKNGNWTHRKTYCMIDGKKTLFFEAERSIAYFE